MVHYDAFISYSHAKDKPIAVALQGQLQRLGKRWSELRSLRIFRDDTSLAASPQLWPSIETALTQSHIFILLASPEAGTSRWVDREVAFWMDHNSSDTFLIALTAGTLQWDDRANNFLWTDGMPLPPAAKGWFKAEPKWVDLRKYREIEKPRGSGFAEACATLAAAIHRIPKEDLLSREIREQRRALTLAWSAAVALFLLSVFALALWRDAAAERDRAERTLVAATQTANELVMEVAVRLRQRIGVPLDVVRDVLARARFLLDRLSMSAGISPELRRGTAIALRELATTLMMQGDTALALEAAERSRDMMLQVPASQAKTAAWMRELSLSYNRIGEALARSDRQAEALKAFTTAFEIRKELAQRNPEHLESQRDLAVSFERIGDHRFVNEGPEEALDSYRDAMDIRLMLNIRAPQNRDWIRDLSVNFEKIGDVLLYLSNIDDAMQAFQKSFELRRQIAEADSTNSESQRDLAISHAKLGDTHRQAGRYKEAVDQYRTSLGVRQRLVKSDTGNVQWQLDLIVILLKLAEVDDSAAHYASAREIAGRLDAEGKLTGEAGARINKIGLH
jgi:tetratricopeptide (TPR) repeat protein